MRRLAKWRRCGVVERWKLRSFRYTSDRAQRCVRVCVFGGCGVWGAVRLPFALPLLVSSPLPLFERTTDFTPDCLGARGVVGGA